MTETNITSPKIKLEQFDGPFHVLVEMLEREKLPITDISLGRVTEQYLKALNSGGQRDPYVLADFLVVAAKLLYLKSKVLLPFLAQGDEEDEVSLEAQLKMYKEYYEASKVIEKMLGVKKAFFGRERLLTDVESIFNPPATLTVHKMQEIFTRVVKELEPIVRVPKKIARQVVSIRDKIKDIRDYIVEKMSSSFSELVKGSRDRTEALITFLALLELVKQQVINVEQEERYGEIKIRSKNQEV